ncbi:hypothetical protein [Modestobacter sp. VKM Ac-2985]|uniref:hypothetical protein n=1 Tax=Modestobacter sp. VKM Ac-2985 TaxID=3004139 RepID=UPI0022AB5793|nr:hypothetical protein [Modestobacter sp. VKM Ac-2985]MCZ2840158.1 hypothetical protein [Modestobacter sp. VKM Ac-2985]
MPHPTSILVSAPPGLAERPAIDWALSKLREAADARSISLQVGTANPADEDAASDLAVTLGNPDDLRRTGGPACPDEAESYAMSVEASAGDGRRLSIAATDDRGFAYALTEVAERLAAGGVASFEVGESEVQRPHVPVRGIVRAFSSVHEDSPWFHDRAFWTDYLDHLAQQRFNRFHLAFGMQYNYGTGFESRTATDNYLCFPYPFLLDVPGHTVRAQGVTDAERDRNFDALAYIAQETKRRGMTFQLGLWNHAYDYGYDSPQWYPILGVGPETHAQYSAAALGLLLERIPEIDGVTFRVHHEGGIHEEGHELFWDVVFQAVSDVGRPIEVDMHSKGVDQALRDSIVKPNIKPVISAKYWAEHLGLPYHQTSIRPQELTPFAWPGMNRKMTGVTDVERRFTRYGYADFLAEDRPIDFMFRMWPGTQKLLLWGDPAMAAGFGRLATIGGSRGVDFCEPLTFKGRRGTGEPGRRDPYVRDDLRLGVHDWRKYRYNYLLWGRLMYDPSTDPEVWRRFLRDDYGAAAADLEEALAQLSRALPLVTVVHGVSVANNHYWPEMYTDLAVSFWRQMTHYVYDTPEPRTWEGVSPFDPTLFYSVAQYCDDALRGSLDARYTPLEVAAWLETMAAEGSAATDRAVEVADPADPQTQRTLIDLRVLVQLARFFASKFRAAVAYALFARTRDVAHLEESARLLEQSHKAYGEIPALVAGVYQDDLAFGSGAMERGTWKDRLMAMREDAYLLRIELQRARAVEPASASPALVQRESRTVVPGRFETAERYTHGDAFAVRLVVDAPVSGAVLRYRHLNQAEEVQSVEMSRVGEHFEAAVPADYTTAPFPLLFFAEVQTDGEHPVLVPGLGASLSDQPYVVVHSTAAAATGD